MTLLQRPSLDCFEIGRSALGLGRCSAVFVEIDDLDIAIGSENVRYS